jgi:hypothetical protein
MVPAFYAADQVVNKRILGNNDPNEKPRNPNQKWYNPTSHIANFAKDIAKTTAMQMGGFMLPGALAGTAKATSTTFFNEQLQNMDEVFARGGTLAAAHGAKQKIAFAGFSLKAMLQEIGHDSVNIIDKGIGVSQRSTGALATAWTESNKASRNPVADLYRQRHGPGGVSGSAIPGSSLSKSKRAAGIAKTIFNGNNQPLSNQMSNESLLDMIPGYQAIRVGAQAGKRQFRTIKDAQTILRDTSQFNSIVANYKDPDAFEYLSKTLQTVQKNATSPLTRVSSFLGTYGRFEVDADGKGQYLAGKKFGEIVERNEYKKILKDKLINGESAVSEKTADKFVRSLQVVDNLEGNTMMGGKEPINPFNRLMMGGEPIHEDDFFETVLSRYNESKYGKANPLGIKGNVLQDTIGKADKQFLLASSDTQAKINSQWNSVYSDYANNAGKTELQPGRLRRSDFDGT